MKWLDGTLDLAGDLKSALHEEISSWTSLLRQIQLPLLALLVGLLVMLSLAKPAPPRMDRLAVGHPPDYSHTIAQSYAAFFKDKGIELELVETEGSLARLDRVRNDVDPIEEALIEAVLERLDRMEQDLKKSRISRKEVIAFYALRNDMDFVRNVLERHRSRHRS